MKVKIAKLFDAYKVQIDRTPNSSVIFCKSGMVNILEQLEYGFFPLGSGILSEKSKIDEAEIEEGGIMVLGNDFGTCSYIVEKCKNKREDNSRTINNLGKVVSEIDKIFFTNFFLGLRNDVKHTGTTMTKLIVNRESEYKSFCFEFFLTQLEIINPRIVICIGKEVGFVLNEYVKNEFSVFNDRTITYSKLYETEDERMYEVNVNNSLLGKRKFIFIPHPSWAHVNWKKHNIESKIKTAIQFAGCCHQTTGS